MGFFQILTITVLDNLSGGLTMLAMGGYMRHLGASYIGLGINNSINSFLSFLWVPVAGSLSDNIGRKSVLLICLITSLLGNTIISNTTKVMPLYIAQTLKSFASPTPTILKSLVDDTSKTKEEALDTFNKVNNLNRILFFVSIITGAFLSENYLGKLMITSAVLNGFNAIFVFLTTPNNKRNPNDTTNLNASTLLKGINNATRDLKNLKWEKYWQLFTVNILGFISQLLFFWNVRLVVLNKFHSSIAWSSYIIVLMAIISVIINAFNEKLKRIFKDPTGEKRLLQTTIIQIITILLLGTTRSFSLFLIFLIPFFVGRVIMEITLNEILLMKIDNDDKGSVIGAFDSNFHLANIIGPLISGFITELWGENVSLTLAFVPLIGVLFIEKTKKHKIK